MVRIFFIVVIIVLAANAASASSAKSAPNGFASHYFKYSCDQLLKEAQKISARAIASPGDREPKSTNNRIVTTEPTVVLPRALDENEPKPASGELADLRERMRAVEDASIQSQCEFEFVSPTGQ